MLPLLLGALGVSGALYALLRLYWSQWYLDWYYQRMNARVGAGAAAAAMKGKYSIDIFEDHVQARPDKTMLYFQDETWSYGAMDRKANQAGRAAVEIGVRPGTTIAMMIFNEPAFVWSYLGRRLVRRRRYGLYFCFSTEMLIVSYS